MRALARLTAAGIACAVLVLPGSALAAPAVESIPAYTMSITAAPSGVLHVRERIVYSFGSTPHHGIERVLLTRTPYDNHHDRLFPVSDVQVSGSPGTPTQLAINNESDRVVLRIGDPNRLITGVHTYVISYVVRGALAKFSDHDELYWNAIGPGWQVPISRAGIQVRGPAHVTRAGCFAGPVSSTLPCTSARITNGVATYRQALLEPGDVFTVVAAFPPGTFPDAAPMLVEHRTLATAFAFTPLSITLAALALAALLGWLAWVYWVAGRDRRYVGQIPGLVPAQGQRVADEPKPLLDHTPVAVEFAPPDHIRPGEVGTLIDEQANTVDVTATIVDLACRGYLRIEQTEAPHRFQSGDWTLTKTDKDTGDLQPYERSLYDALFGSRSSVTISELKGTFAGDLAVVQNKLYDDVVAKGWFSRRPDQVRSGWLGVGLALGVAGLIATFFLARHTHLGIAGVAVVIGALGVLAVHNRMPAKTATGSAMFARVLGFRTYLETAEAEQLKFEEKADVFARYLPFAIVFGVTDKWAHAFAKLAQGNPAIASSALGWYAGPPGWDLAFFAASLSSFTTSTSGVIAAQAMNVSSGGLGGGFGGGFGGGGFAGGGGGGGGGGSW